MELPMSTLQTADIAPVENNTNINKEKGKRFSDAQLHTFKYIILTVVVVIAVHLWAVLACIHDIEKAVPLLIVVGINWRTVTWGYSVQFCFGLLVLRWPWGSLVFQRAADLTVKFLQLTDLGSSFVYGYLAKPLPICEMEPVLAFSALQVLVFFGAVVSLLYYYSIIQWILKRMASFTQLTLGTTAVESLNACACVFLGQAESALLFGPYVEKQTASELHAIMTSGFSCIAGSLFAAYVSFGACPRYLLSSTVMSAPGSLACAKIMFPETEDSLSRKVSDLTLPPRHD
ncbi:hypothetical protein Q1695_011435 [Nippostrongylus brasiliensis]|nr:hypothetical protein Q1695_011435 [Nippostrongylus brasiliensis]